MYVPTSCAAVSECPLATGYSFFYGGSVLQNLQQVRNKQELAKHIKLFRVSCNSFQGTRFILQAIAATAP